MRQEDTMRPFIPMTVLAVGAAMALSLMSLPAKAQYAHCMPALGCIPTTQASYNACLQLARQRGWAESDNAPKGGVDRRLDLFIFQCLAGRIPR
jgi:hypothetical protein